MRLTYFFASIFDHEQFSGIHFKAKINNFANYNSGTRKALIFGSIFGIFQSKFRKDIAVLEQKNAKMKNANLV
jgi:hypothetical protein